MGTSRREFLAMLSAAGALPPATGFGGTGTGEKVKGKIGVQLYSVREYIAKNGIVAALKELAAIGYKGVEFVVTCYGKKPEELRRIMADLGMEACGFLERRSAFEEANAQKTCDMALALGTDFVCASGGGNMPPGCTWGNQHAPPSAEVDRFMDETCEFYNRAAERFGKLGCKVGVHNHQWEFNVKRRDGTMWWDWFFRHTTDKVLMEQDVGWTMSKGIDPCGVYRKYAGRSYSLHARENGRAGAKGFSSIVGEPGEGCAGVDWRRLLAVAEAEKIKWWVVECENGSSGFGAVAPSYKYLNRLGLT